MGQATFQNSAVYNVAGFAGATNGDKLVACIAVLPTTGGTCDARSLPSGGTIPGFTITKSGVNIKGPCGAQSVSGTILVHAGASSVLTSLNWEGCGSTFGQNATMFNWTGDAISPMFYFIGVRDSGMSKFGIQGFPATPLITGIQQTSQTPGGSDTTISTNNSFRDINITGQTTNSLFIGMRWLGAGGNNDESLIEHVFATNVMWSAFSIEGAQSKSHLLQHAGCVGLGQNQANTWPNCITTAFLSVTSLTLGAGGSGYNNGVVRLTVSGGNCLQQPQVDVNVSAGVVGSIAALPIPGVCYTEPSNPAATTPNVGGGTGATVNLTVQQPGGSFVANNILGANNTIDFYLGAPTDTITITGGDLENSNRLLVTNTGTSTAWPVIITGMRWAANNLATDNFVVIYKDKGGVVLIGNNFDGANTSATPLFSLQPTSFASQGVAIGNVISWGDAIPGEQPFVTDAPGNGQWRLVGNTIVDNSGVSTPVGDTLGNPPFYVTTTAASYATISGGSSGTGGTPGAVTLTATGGTCGTQPQFSGTISAGGILTALTAFTPTTAGACTAPAVNPVTVTGGGLTGAQLNIFYTNQVVPTCNANRKGFILNVNDATTPTFKGTYSGGGAVQTTITCNGTTWLTGN